MMVKENYLVRVCCATFNHALYIEDAMNGFCIQNTHFPFVCAIVDDASTDGEQEIIKKYLGNHFDIINDNVHNDDCIRIFAQHKINKNCFFAVSLLNYNHYSINKSRNQYFEDGFDNPKYVAYCEGDDYWVDPLKLQKQITYMESHLECSLCFTGAKVIFDNGFEKVDNKEYKSLYVSLEERDYDGNELLKSWILPTASIIYKNSIKVKTDKRFMFGDIIIGLSAAEYGEIHCIPEKMVVYRRNSNGLSAKPQSLPRSINHYKAIEELFGEKYKKTCKHHISRSIASSLLTGDKNERKDAINALMENPEYIFQIFFSMMEISITALKKRIIG